eukprot:5205242-Amphidinium_carterae.1
MSAINTCSNIAFDNSWHNTQQPAHPHGVQPANLSCSSGNPSPKLLAGHPKGQELKFHHESAARS